MRGATHICIFTGIMDAELYVNILDQCLPRITGSCRIMTINVYHNELKGTLRRMASIGGGPPIIPRPQSIENVWHELKEFLRARVKPRNLAELKAGIKLFRNSVSPANCAKYINHLQKVIPRIFELKGDATGY